MARHSGVFVSLIGKGCSDLLLRPANFHLRKPHQHEPVGLGQGWLGHRTGPQVVAEHHVDLRRPQGQLRAQVEPGKPTPRLPYRVPAMPMTSATVFPSSGCTSERS